MDIAIKTKRILKECGAFKDGGHFVYHSGLHGDFYLNKDALYARPLLLDDICVLLTDVAIGVYGRSFDTVLAPAISGILLGQGIAYRDWETDRKSTRLNSSHSAKSRMPSSA